MSDSAAAAASSPDFMTQANYARLRGVTRQTVQKWKNQGHLVLVAVDGAVKKRIDVAATNANLDALQNPLKTQNTAPEADSAPAETEPAVNDHPPKDQAGERLKVSRAFKETAEARTANLKYERLASNLVPRIEVQGVGPAAAALLHQSQDRRRTDLAKQLEGRALHDILVILKNDDRAVLLQFAESLRDYDSIGLPDSDPALRDRQTA